MKTTDTRFDISRLERALSGDFRSHPIAYPILAKHGFMEITPNGYKSIDCCQVIDRCRELIKRLR